MWELNGYGDPIYVNNGYAWRNHFENNPPQVPEKDNHVGTYRKEIEIPADWKGKDVIAHFGSATSNISLWVNGKYVGYGEDSKLENEFDITPYIRPDRRTSSHSRFSAGVTEPTLRTRTSSVSADSPATAISMHVPRTAFRTSA